MVTMPRFTVSGDREKDRVAGRSSPWMPVGHVLVACVFLLACKDDSKPVAAPPSPPPAVTVTKVLRKETTPTSNFVGRVEATDKVNLRARVSGFLEQRLFQEGADVKKGDVLFVIEKAPYKTEISKIKAEIVGADAVLKTANIELERQEELVRRQVATLAKRDEARAKQGEAQASLLNWKAGLEQAELNLSYTDVVAPITGRVGRAQFSVGNFVEPSSGSLGLIVSQDPIYVSFPVTQREILEYRKRAAETGANPRALTVRVRLADGQLYKESGEINFVDVQVNQATDTVTVRARFPNPNRTLVDGQLVNVVVEGQQPELALMIPQQAIQLDQTGPFVLIVDNENKVRVRHIQLGPRRAGESLVLKGLSEGDRIITEGVQKVRPEQVVQPTEAELRAEAPK